MLVVPRCNARLGRSIAIPVDVANSERYMVSTEFSNVGDPTPPHTQSNTANKLWFGGQMMGAVRATQGIWMMPKCAKHNCNRCKEQHLCRKFACSHASFAIWHFAKLRKFTHPTCGQCQQLCGATCRMFIRSKDTVVQ